MTDLQWLASRHGTDAGTFSRNLPRQAHPFSSRGRRHRDRCSDCGMFEAAQDARGQAVHPTRADPYLDERWRQVGIWSGALHAARAIRFLAIMDGESWGERWRRLVEEGGTVPGAEGATCSGYRPELMR